LPWVKSPFFGGHRWPLAAFGGPRLAQVVAERGGLSEALGLRRRELAAWEAAVGAEDPRTDLDGPGGLGTASYPSLFQFYSNFLIYPILYNVIPILFDVIQLIPIISNELSQLSTYPVDL